MLAALVEVEHAPGFGARSRLVAYWASAAGLTAGALVYAAVSGRPTLRVLMSMDYCSFAAY